jgi:hypothetical protein
MSIHTAFNRGALLRLWRVDAERTISEESVRRYRELGGHLNLRVFLPRKRRRAVSAKHKIAVAAVRIATVAALPMPMVAAGGGC